MFDGEDIFIKKSALVIIAVLGIGIASLASLKGGYLRTFNDIFALSGYAAIAIFIYFLNVKWIKKCVMFISEISYELYLLHILVFEVIFYLIKIVGTGEWILGIAAILISTLLSRWYHIVLVKFKCK